ncbi:hypothetical protein C798_20395 [Herbaspirillum rubrisubalbicans Os34]|uniref:MafI family immunity protein n=1 Tax=Herbaspirillum rubrisubalbicans Os34 TaxID=1235827 RepID=A0A6M3ZUZ1_9BURK|nr:MafI family immunity protein [Herbaspirillum rubrisubalbicans]QJQ02499.1 hypothetical protein C798_20395 [Herbaspirillum rubrisubalbicans Os34]
MEIQYVLLSVLKNIRDDLPFEKHELINELIEAGEFGVALEFLVEFIVEYNISISSKEWNLLIQCGDQMRIDVARLTPGPRGFHI